MSLHDLRGEAQGRHFQEGDRCQGGAGIQWGATAKIENASLTRAKMNFRIYMRTPGFENSLKQRKTRHPNSGANIFFKMETNFEGKFRGRLARALAELARGALENCPRNLVFFHVQLFCCHCVNFPTPKRPIDLRGKTRRLAAKKLCHRGPKPKHAEAE